MLLPVVGNNQLNGIIITVICLFVVGVGGE